MTNTQATTAQVRQSFKNQGQEVRITREGRVSFRSADQPVGARNPWLEGRWVSEYRIGDTGDAILFWNTFPLPLPAWHITHK